MGESRNSDRLRGGVYRFRFSPRNPIGILTDPPMSEHIKVSRSGKHTVNLEGKIDWKYAVDPKSGHIIGICPSLNIVLEAESIEELFKLIGESMAELFSTVVEDGSLEDFLAARKLKPRGLGNVERRRIELNPGNVQIRAVTPNDLELAAC